MNPWAKPYQQPHPPIWIPGVMSRNTVEWSAQHRYPYIMLATDLEPTKQSFEYYAEVAKEEGYEAGTQHRGYLFKVHVDETEELAYETARKYIEGPPNPFLEGNQGVIRSFLQNLPGMTSRTNLLPTSLNRAARISRGREQRGADPKSSETTRQDFQGTYDDQLKRYTIITGTPKTVIPKVRHVLEYLRPGTIFFWDGDGAMTHEDQMRSLKLFGEEVIPAVREIGEELELYGSYEVDPSTNQPVPAEAAN